MSRIGIMGGTFNPIHNGHLAIAEKAREQFALEKVLFMPSGIPYMKDQTAVLPVQARFDMTTLAIRDMPGFELSEIEAEDVLSGKNTYTCDTLQKLRTADPEAGYHFIMGADSLYAIEEWKNPALIFRNCTILVALRSDEPSSGQQEISENGACGQAESRERPQERLLGQVRYLREKYRASVEILEFAGMDISSTQIREMVRKGASLRGLLPEAVEKYIRENNLYKKERKEP